MPINNHGVILLDMDFINHNKVEAIHTLIHEMIHALSLILVYEKDRAVYKCGVNRSGKTFNRLNEGVTEYLAQMVWQKMYINKTCPGVGRYYIEVQAVKKILDLFDNEEQFFKDYLSNGLLLQAQMRDIKNSQNMSLYEFVKSFDQRDFGNEKVKKLFVDGCDDFMFVQNLKK